MPQMNFANFRGAVPRFQNYAAVAEQGVLFITPEANVLPRRYDPFEDSEGLLLDVVRAGAAVAGCCAQMVGFAVMSFRENRWGGLLAQGLGTSMLQVPNIIRRPVIWLPAIVSSAILGPVGTMAMNMQSNASGSGMGSCGLVGQIMTWQTMIQAEPPVTVLIKILVIQIILPAAVTLGISELMRKKGWIEFGDMKLEM